MLLTQVLQTTLTHPQVRPTIRIQTIIQIIILILIKMRVSLSQMCKQITLIRTITTQNLIIQIEI